MELNSGDFPVIKADKVPCLLSRLDDNKLFFNNDEIIGDLLPSVAPSSNLNRGNKLLDFISVLILPLK